MLTTNFNLEIIELLAFQNFCGGGFLLQWKILLFFMSSLQLHCKICV